ncbi:MAG: hypothetical protein IPP90_13045 [Gemmatimonadaceae bacterium]|nr:hypothetical protein [Gemmatimonadaceae bacterium]
MDRSDLKLAWMYVGEKLDQTARFHVQYMVGTPDGVSQFSEMYEVGLFTRAQYVEAFQRAGLKGTHIEDGLWKHGAYIGVDASIHSVGVA